MVSPSNARFAVGVIGNIISLFLYLSPMPTFIRICKKGSVQQYSATTYQVTLLNCMWWGLYGMPFIHPNSILVATIAGIGFFIELAYLMLFVIYAGNNRRRVILILITVAEVLGVGLTLVVLLCFCSNTARRSQVIGLLGDISGVLMYAAPLSVMKQVIKTKSVEFMPLPVSVTSLANALVWTLYAIHPLDPYVAAPNGLGCILGLAQLILYGTYYKSTKKQMEAQKAAVKLEMDLKEVIVVTCDPTKVNDVHNIDLSIIPTPTTNQASHL